MGCGGEWKCEVGGVSESVEVCGVRVSSEGVCEG